ncbi:MAG: flavodoxin-dependent (E)-4-hydroxy-3-methylbut-2-enyl-diphosphate synthase [Candidatus Cloacimonetes bacterium]|nr:flavodoxin-dependent (E)-4-hydroxy-3-methylbut-2-enyl-diphosphate synthase [Candidatus Cloacimonadota bacterium]
MIKRKQTRKIKLGSMFIGGDSPISIQSMCTTKTYDTINTLKQIKKLEQAGCEIVRIAIPDMESAEAIKSIKSRINIPLIADIHFDYRLAIAAIDADIDGIRLNPGNIGSEEKIKLVIDKLKEKNIPVRIGVNSGSIAKHILSKYGVSAQGIVESALEHVKILEKHNYDNIKISVKASSVPLTIESYRLLSQKTDYPLHLGVTESGTDFAGTIKSSIGIGTLLAEGIGDTIRVSLTADPVNEIVVAKQILKSLNLRKGLELISCPTCGRTNIPLIDIVNEAQKQLEPFANLDITVAVMGCEVNGPGEAREADYGIAGGKNEGLVFKKGEIIKKVPTDMLIPELLKLIKADIK